MKEIQIYNCLSTKKRTGLCHCMLFCMCVQHETFDKTDIAKRERKN